MKIHTLPHNILLLLNGHEVIKMKYRSYSYDEYLRAMEMIKKLGVIETSKRLGIHWRTLYDWKNGEHIPPAAKWIPEPSSELAYIIGVLLGDGSVSIDEYYHYRIQLGVKDLEFTEAFSRAMAKTLNKKYSIPKWSKSSNKWIVTYHSKAFYVWFKQQTMKALRQYIEYNKETATSFLKGLYDSEGNHNISKKGYIRIRLSNNNIELLRYAQYLLKRYLNIIATGPYLNAEAGEENKIENRKIKRKSNNYQISINRKQYTRKFLSEIGFSIEEKQLGLPRRE